MRDVVATSKPRRALVALLTAALLGGVAAGCGGNDDSPNADDVPSGAVATIGDVEISSEDLDGQVDALARAQRGDGAPANADGGPDPGTAEAEAAKQRRAQLEAQALSMLLQREALEQEAADRDIEASLADARARWEPVARRQFRTEKALKRFLGGQTERDLLDQLRLQILAERIDAQVSENAGDGKQGKLAVKKFRAEFRKRWQDGTTCANGYTATGCTTPNPR